MRHAIRLLALALATFAIGTALARDAKPRAQIPQELREKVELTDAGALRPKSGYKLVKLSDSRGQITNAAGTQIAGTFDCSCTGGSCQLGMNGGNASCGGDSCCSLTIIVDEIKAPQRQ